MNRPLTTRQLQILDLIDDYDAENGFPPTIRELCDLLGISSTNGVKGHLRALRSAGACTWIPGRSRTLRTVARRDLRVLGTLGTDGRITWAG